MQNPIRWLGHQTSRATGGVFHYVGAAANVFWMNQMRFSRLLGSFFITNSVWKTLTHFGMFLTPPIILTLMRQYSISGRRAEIAEINSATTRMSEAALQAHAQKFAASYAHMTDTLDASGHGLKMVNIFPILLTLANVYGGGLDDNGTIANDGDWSAYLIISFASFLVFFCQGYNSNRSESEQLLREFFAAVDSKVPDVGQGQGSLNADSESAPGGYATMWHRIYRDGNKDPHAVLNELMEKLQPDREERTPLLL